MIIARMEIRTSAKRPCSPPMIDTGGSRRLDTDRVGPVRHPAAPPNSDALAQATLDLGCGQADRS
jgi:hypothetical protein